MKLILLVSLFSALLLVGCNAEEEYVTGHATPTPEDPFPRPRFDDYYSVAPTATPAKATDAPGSLMLIDRYVADFAENSDCANLQSLRKKHFHDSDNIRGEFSGADWAIYSHQIPGALVGAERVSYKTDTVFFLTGEDSDLFMVGPSDSPIDERRPSVNEDEIAIRIARPLPRGTYEFQVHFQTKQDLICEYKPGHGDYGHSTWTSVDVLAAQGVHAEFLFDPGDSIIRYAEFKAQGYNGYSYGIQSIEWIDGHFILTLSGKFIDLRESSLDFIGLDGAVVLSLDFSDAVLDITAQTYTWPLDNLPWQDTDKLMGRIWRKDLS